MIGFYPKMILSDPGNPSNFIYYKILPNFKASLLWVLTNWSPKDTQAEIYNDDRSRHLKKPEENVYYYEYKFDISDSSTLAIIHSTFAFFILLSCFRILLIIFVIIHIFEEIAEVIL